MAEYITGQELRKYVAEKVKKYTGDVKTVFDGAVGSGQLEQYVNPEIIYGCDIQKESVETALYNFPNSKIEKISFFNYRNDIEADCVIMNPPFSIKFKDLSEEEQANVQEQFEWKKSGNVDDMFVLMSLKYTKRYGFYIMFPGVGYRNSEKKFREVIGNRIAELNIIDNAFDDTSISVLFLVIDKEKTTDEVYREKIDMINGTAILNSDTVKIEKDRWEQIAVESEIEEIDIDATVEETSSALVGFVKNRMELDLFLAKEFGLKIDILGNIKKIRKICSDTEKDFRSIKSKNIEKEINLETLKLFTNVGVKL